MFIWNREEFMLFLYYNIKNTQKKKCFMRNIYIIKKKTNNMPLI